MIITLDQTVPDSTRTAIADAADLADSVNISAHRYTAPACQGWESCGWITHRVVRGQRQSSQDGFVGRAEVDGDGLPFDFDIDQQARPGGCRVKLLNAHDYAVSLMSTPGRWHIGNGLDWVCRSVPRSNLRGSCFA